jgi:hypothetical protein
MMYKMSIFIVLVLLSGCSRSGPDSIDTTSAEFTSLQKKIEVVERYVKFRRAYETLDFAITYSNNSGGMVPGPSDWDIRLIATVPEAEIQDWIPPGVKSSSVDSEWLKSVPTSLDLSGLNEWYKDEDGHRISGIDRQRRIIAYRIWKN